jgi:hypothetical protein
MSHVNARIDTFPGGHIESMDGIFGLCGVVVTGAGVDFVKMLVGVNGALVVGNGFTVVLAVDCVTNVVFGDWCVVDDILELSTGEVCLTVWYVVVVLIDCLIVVFGVDDVVVITSQYG